MSQPPSPGREGPTSKPEPRNVMTAELLLLLRLALSDEAFGRREADALEGAAKVLGLGAEDVAEVLSAFDGIATQRDVAAARLSLREDSRGHAWLLARLLFDLVARDATLAPRAHRLAARVGDILGLAPQEMEDLAAEALQR